MAKRDEIHQNPIDGAAIGALLKSVDVGTEVTLRRHVDPRFTISAHGRTAGGATIAEAVANLATQLRKSAREIELECNRKADDAASRVASLDLAILLGGA